MFCCYITLQYYKNLGLRILSLSLSLSLSDVIYHQAPHLIRVQYFAD